MITNLGSNGHNGNSPKQRFRFSQVNYCLGVGLTVASTTVTLGTLLLFSSLPLEVVALLLHQSVHTATVGKHLVEKGRDKDNK